MNQTNDKPGNEVSTMNLNNYSISELAEMLSQSEDVDDAILFEQVICKNINEENVHEIEGLFESEDRYCNLSALGILSDSGYVGLSNIYHCVDQLFERDDLILKRQCISLISQHGYNQQAASKRMAQFVDFPDEPIRESIRVWLLGRTIKELKEFVSSSEPFEGETVSLIETIILFKSQKLSLDQFLERVSKIDDIAFREYERLSQVKTRYAQGLFRSG